MKKHNLKIVRVIGLWNVGKQEKMLLYIKKTSFKQKSLFLLGVILPMLTDQHYSRRFY